MMQSRNKLKTKQRVFLLVRGLVWLVCLGLWMQTGLAQPKAISLSDLDRIAIVPFHAQSGLDCNAIELEQSLTSYWRKYAGLQVFEPGQLKSLLDAKRYQDMLSCGDDKFCYAKLGRSIGARYIVRAHLNQGGRHFSVILQAIYVDEPDNSLKAQRTFCGPASKLSKVLHDAADALLGNAPLTKTIGCHEAVHEFGVRLANNFIALNNEGMEVNRLALEGGASYSYGLNERLGLQLQTAFVATQAKRDANAAIDMQLIPVTAGIKYYISSLPYRSYLGFALGGAGIRARRSDLSQWQLSFVALGTAGFEWAPVNDRWLLLCETQFRYMSLSPELLNYKPMAIFNLGLGLLYRL